MSTRHKGVVRAPCGDGGGWGPLETTGERTGRVFMKFKRLLATTAVAGVIAVGAVSGPAFAASVHLKGGANSAPTFTDNGPTLAAAGALAGLGNADLQVDMTATGNPIAVCVNPAVRNGKDNEPPGQNPAPLTLS